MPASQRATEAVQAARTSTKHSAVQLLSDNIAALPHKNGTIKHPYFGGPAAINSPGLNMMRKMFCEAIIDLLDEHGHLNERP